MKKPEPHPLAWRKLQLPVAAIISYLVLLLCLFQTVTNFRQELISVFHSFLNSRQPRISRNIRANGWGRTPIHQLKG